MDGIHLLGEWFDCSDTLAFSEAPALRALCLALTERAGLSAVGDRFHQFAPRGVTGTVLLAESHLAIHTWPEERFATVDDRGLRHAETLGYLHQVPGHRLFAIVFAGDGANLLTREGRKQLEAELNSWKRLSNAVALVIQRA